MCWLYFFILHSLDSDVEYGGGLDSLNTHIIVHHTGDMKWLTPLIIKAKCDISVLTFSHDTQICHLKYGSWTYEADEMTLTSGGINHGK